jgi:aryl-alcohol dehydrogenase-like predicted oxidoreductase
MKYKQLGSSGVNVSEVCLGTMTWGQQNSQQDANLQLEFALEKGINFVDTAEMYSVPPKAETQGSTEKIIGNWINANPGKREQVFLASKITGNGVSWIRDGSDISRDTIKQAVDNSLQRLQTDYIDLYQLHWPNRTSPHFAKHWPGMVLPGQIDKAEQEAGMLDILQGLDDCVKAGKIRHCGLSNETPWGISEYLRLSAAHNLPRMVSIQNEFSLLHLKDSPYLIESCVLSDVAFLPWSPLAGGALSGKYRNGARPENCRWTMTQRKGIFRDTTSTAKAIEAFYKVANKHGLSLAQLSLAWVYQCDGVTSTIIGATSMEQLQENLAAYELELSEELIAEVGQVIRQFPMPF